MNTSVGNIADAQQIAEAEQQDQIAGAGADPQYLSSDHLPLDQLDKFSDSAKISGRGLNSVAANSMLSSGSEKIENEEEQYLANTSQYRQGLEGNENPNNAFGPLPPMSPPSPEETPPEEEPPPADPPPPNSDSDEEETSGTGGTSSSSGTSSTSGSGDAFDALNSYDEETTKALLGFTDEDYAIDPDGDGYLEGDAEALEAWVEYMLERLNVMMCLLIALSSLFENKRIADEIFSGIPKQPDENNSYKEVFSRKARMILKMVNTAVMNVFKYINKKNQETYNERVQELKDESETSGHKTEDFFTGGDASAKLMEQKLEEDVAYLEATTNTLESLQQVLNAIITYLLKAAAENDETSVMYLGMVKSLRGFNEEIDELCEEAEEKLEEALGELEEYQERDVVNGGGLLLFFLNPMAWAIWAIDKAANTDFADDLEPIDDIDMQSIIDDYRGSLTAMQNSLRMYYSLKMLKQDLRNIVFNKFTGLTGMGNNAELLMVSAESSMGNVISMFDATSTQLMIKSQLHNAAVQSLESLQQMEKSKPLQVLTAALSIAVVVIAIIIAVIVAVVTIGGGSLASVGLVLAALALAGALAGAGAGASAAATKAMLADIEGFNPSAPTADEIKEEGWEHGGDVLDQLEYLEREEEANRRAAAKNRDALMIESDDGFTQFDSEAFAVYEMRQNTIANAIRCIFSILKNSRDMRRIAEATFTGHSFRDSGESLLQNAVENILTQKQMLLSAMKFQYQQKVAADNIEYQKQKAKDDMWKEILISALVAVVAIILYLIPGLQLLGATLNILMMVGLSAYRWWDAAQEDTGIGQDIESSGERDLRDMLSEKGGESTEAMLDEAEMEAYLEVLDEENSLQDTGDGYRGINSDFITQIYDKIGKIYNMKEMLVSVRALKSEMRSIVEANMAGISVGTSGDLTKTTNKASFRTAMKVVGNLVAFLNARVAVLNRARDAEKALKRAKVMFVVNCAIAAVSFALLALTNLANISKLLIEVFQTMFKMAPAVMSLTNAVLSMAFSLHDWKSDTGELGAYEAKTTVDKTGRKESNPQNIDQALEDAEYDVLCEMNQELIVTLDGSYQTVSATSTDLSWRLEQLNNIKEALAVVRSILSAAKRAAGLNIRPSDFGRGNVQDQEAIVLSVLDSLKSALEAIVSRENQKQAALKSVVLTALDSILSAASLSCSIIAATKTIKANKLDPPVYDNPQAAKDAGSAAPIDATTTPPAVTATDATVTPAATTDTSVLAPDATPQPVQTPQVGNSTTVSVGEKGETLGAKEASKDVKGEKKVKSPKKLRMEAKSWQIASTLIGTAKTILKALISKLYDEAKNENAKKNNKHASQEKARSTAKNESSSSAKGSNYLESMSSMDDGMATADYNLAVSQNNINATAYIVARQEAWLKFLAKDLALTLSGAAKSMGNDLETMYALKNDGNEKAVPKLTHDEQKEVVAMLDQFSNKTPETCASFILADVDKKNYSSKGVAHALHKMEDPAKAAATLQEVAKTDVARATEIVRELASVDASAAVELLDQMDPAMAEKIMQNIVEAAPEKAALILAEKGEIATAEKLASIDASQAARVLMETSSEDAAEILKHIDSAQAGEIVQKITEADLQMAVNIVENSQSADAAKIIANIDPEIAAKILGPALVGATVEMLEHIEDASTTAAIIEKIAATDPQKAMEMLQMLSEINAGVAVEILSKIGSEETASMLETVRAHEAMEFVKPLAVAQPAKAAEILVNMDTKKAARIMQKMPKQIGEENTKVVFQEVAKTDLDKAQEISKAIKLEEAKKMLRDIITIVAGQIPEATEVQVAPTVVAPAAAMAAGEIPFIAEERNTQSTRSRTEALLKQAKQIEEHIVARASQQVEEIAQEITGFQEQISETRGEIQQLPKTRETREERIELRERLQRLKAELNAVRAERRSVVKTMRELQQQIRQIRRRIPRILESAAREVHTMLGKEGETKGLTSRQDAWLKSAGSVLDEKVAQLEEQLKEAKGKLQSCVGKTRDLQKAITRVSREVERQDVQQKAVAQAETSGGASSKSASQAANNGGVLAALSSFIDSRKKKFEEKITRVVSENLDEQFAAIPDGVLSAGSKVELKEKLTAIMVGAKAKHNPRQSYEEVMLAEQGLPEDTKKSSLINGVLT